jgi:hypothetical protein
MERDADGKYICPYNEGCSCDTPECDKCGWNPKVAERRLRNYKEGVVMFEKKYKIPFTGYCEVYARSAEEALEKADHDDMYYADYDFGDPICLDEEEENEVD